MPAEFKTMHNFPWVTKPHQADWTVSDVMDFLETCRSKLGGKVDQYKQVVAENDVDGEVLADMTDEQLQRCPACSH
jgi:hypothetical protein